MHSYCDVDVTLQHIFFFFSPLYSSHIYTTRLNLLLWIDCYCFIFPACNASAIESTSFNIILIDIICSRGSKIFALFVRLTALGIFAAINVYTVLNTNTRIANKRVNRLNIFFENITLTLRQLNRLYFISNSTRWRCLVSWLVGFCDQCKMI